MYSFIQYSSQFSYFTMNDSLSRLSTILKIGNRENVYTRSDISHTPSHWSTGWILERTWDCEVLTPFMKSSFENY